MLRIISVFVLLICVSGCVSTPKATPVADAIARYKAGADQVQLGDAKEKVLSILGPTQDGIPAESRKSSESYVKDGKTVEIFFFRSLCQPDNLTTDDEFTPYVFSDGKLASIGWAALGGPKTHGIADYYQF